jgi:hypothetical protein
MTVDEVINMADEYLYKGKNTGKNCVITIWKGKLLWNQIQKR